MKKILMLVVLTIAIGGFSIVANAQGEESEKCSVTLEDIDEDGHITYKDVLDYTVMVKVQKYAADSNEARDLWSIHEEARRMTVEQAENLLEEVLLQY